MERLERFLGGLGIVAQCRHQHVADPCLGGRVSSKPHTRLGLVGIEHPQRERGAKAMFERFGRIGENALWVYGWFFSQAEVNLAS